MSLSWRPSLGIFVVLAACGGTAIVDPPDGSDTGGSTPIDDDGSGAGTPTGTPSGVGGSGGQPFEPDGVISQSDEGVAMRVVSFPISCATAEIEPPFGECNWYDLGIRVFIDQIIEGLVIPESSDQASAFISVAGDGSNGNCAMSGGGGPLFDDVTIVQVESDRVLIELGPDWDILSVDGGSLAGQHWLALCE